MAALAIAFGIVWIAFWVGWLIAGATAKASHRRDPRQVAMRLAIIVVIVVLRAVLHPRGLVVHNPVLHVVGSLLFVAGLATAIWARVHLGRNWGMPMTEKRDAELVTTGPYALVRNPIYSGILLAILGTAVALDLYVLIALIVFGTYFIYSAIVEETIMERLFPDTYPAYRARTKRLIPYVL